MPTARPNAPTWKVVTAFAIIYLVWGFSYLAIHVTLESFPPYFAAGSRFLIAGSLLYAISFRGAARPTRRQWRSAIILGFLMFFVGNGSLMWAQKLLSSGMAATLYATTPLCFAIIGWLWFGQHRPWGRSLIGLVMGFAGIVFLIGPGDTTTVNPVGALLILCSTLGWTTGSLLSRRLDTPASVSLGAAMNLLASGIMLTIASGMTGEFSLIHPEKILPQSLLSLGYLALGPSLLSFSSYMWLLSVVPPNRVSTYAYVNPVVAVFVGWAVLGEEVTLHTLIASAVILGGVVLITSQRPKPAATSAQSSKLNVIPAETVSAAP